MHLSQIAKVLNGQHHGPEHVCDKFSIDTRTLQLNDCFFALKGDTFDAHQFLTKAQNQGAGALIVNEEATIPEGITIPYVQVKDTEEALRALATWHRSKFDIPVIGITGSCGKTSVKELTASILQQKGKTLYTQGNFNNHIGLPLSVLKIKPEHKFAVFEMGASHKSEIGLLCDIAKPSITVVNNVGGAHLEGFGSIEGVAKAKGEIYQALSDDGIAIVNQDDHFLPYFQECIGNRQTISFGLNGQTVVSAKNIHNLGDGQTFLLCLPNQAIEVRLPLLGRHNIYNALCAASIAFALDIDIISIKNGLQNAKGVAGRLELSEGPMGSRIINDAYNANPSSVSAAIDVLAGLQGEKIVVLGDMGELGDEAIQWHAKMGLLAKSKGVQTLLTVGELSKYASDAFGFNAKHFQSQNELATYCKSLINSQSIILVKGSRSAKMENIVSQLVTLEHKDAI